MIGISEHSYGFASVVRCTRADGIYDFNETFGSGMTPSSGPTQAHFARVKVLKSP